MDHLEPHHITIMFLGLGVLLATSRFLGEIAQWMKQPVVLGEIAAGIILGPTVLGRLAPDLNQAIFPPHGPNALLLEALSTLAIALFLLVAGMEVDLSTIWKQGTVVLRIGTVSLVVPFILGISVAALFPHLIGRQQGADPVIFSLFFATALSISALPLIAKMLMDLDLTRTDFGMILIAAAVMNDMVGWIVFATILSMIGVGSSAALVESIGLTIVFTVGMLTLGRSLIHRVFPYLQAYSHWPGGVLAFSTSLAFFCAALTEWLGIHAMFGAFLAGVAIGDTPHLQERTRTVVDQFISFIFAPIFFASIGLRIDFMSNFNWQVVLVILTIASVGKILGGLLGGMWCRLPTRESLALGFGMNSRGAMEIVLGLIALRQGLIRNQLFVALVVMAIGTSILSGPLVQWILGRKKPRRFADFLTAARFRKSLTSLTRWEAITEMVPVACAGTKLNPEEVEAAVRRREETMSTGLEHGIAIPHATIEGLTSPIVAFGISPGGIDFDAADGQPAHFVFMVLSPTAGDLSQLEIVSDIARSFRADEVRHRAIGLTSYTELLALLKIEQRRTSDESRREKVLAPGSNPQQTS